MNMEWVAVFEVHRAVYIVNTRCTGEKYRLQMQNPRVLFAALFTACFFLVSLFTYPSTLKIEAVPFSGT
jgi:ABC-type Co2+ transport system permease subunit